MGDSCPGRFLHAAAECRVTLGNSLAFAVVLRLVCLENEVTSGRLQMVQRHGWYMGNVLSN